MTLNVVLGVCSFSSFYELYCRSMRMLQDANVISCGDGYIVKMHASNLIRKACAITVTWYMYDV